MSLNDLLLLMRTALNNRDIEKAFNKLDAIEEVVHRANAWEWLQQNSPEDYEQFKKKVEQARDREGLAQSSKSELGQLAIVIEWCQTHGIELVAFDLPGHLGNYREAASYLYHLTSSDKADRQTVEDVREALEEINTHETRRETRAMVRTSHTKTQDD